MIVRFAVLVAAMVFLAACQETVKQPTGSGPLVLSGTSAKAVHDWSYGVEKDHYQLSIAADKRSGGVSMQSCPDPRKARCVTEKDEDFHKPLEQLAMERCSGGGKRDCAMYSIDRQVVWDGPVMAVAGTKRLVPFNGTWPLQIIRGEVTEEMVLVGIDGKLSATGGIGAKDCPVEITYQNSGTGTLKLHCGDAPLTIRFQGNVRKELRGRGRDANGNRVRFVLALDKGTARLGTN